MSAPRHNTPRPPAGRSPSRNWRTGSGRCRPPAFTPPRPPAPPPGKTPSGYGSRGHLCEWVDHTLIENAGSQQTAFLAANIIGLLTAAVHGQELGWVLGADGFVDLYGGTLQRAPDVSVILNEQRPNGLAARGYSEGAPALCVEVYSTSNTRPEMERKRTEYFENGCRLCWTVFPATDRRPATVEVHTPQTGPGDDAGTVLSAADDVSAAPVLPSFTVPCAQLFRRGG